MHFLSLTAFLMGCGSDIADTDRVDTPLPVVIRGSVPENGSADGHYHRPVEVYVDAKTWLNRHHLSAALNQGTRSVAGVFDYDTYSTSQKVYFHPDHTLQPLTEYRLRLDIETGGESAEIQFSTNELGSNPTEEVAGQFFVADEEQARWTREDTWCLLDLNNFATGLAIGFPDSVAFGHEEAVTVYSIVESVEEPCLAAVAAVSRNDSFPKRLVDDLGTANGLFQVNYRSVTAHDIAIDIAMEPGLTWGTMSIEFALDLEGHDIHWMWESEPWCVYLSKTDDPCTACPDGREQCLRLRADYVPLVLAEDQAPEAPSAVSECSSPNPQ